MVAGDLLKRLVVGVVQSLMCVLIGCDVRILVAVVQATYDSVVVRMQEDCDGLPCLLPLLIFLGNQDSVGLQGETHTHIHKQLQFFATYI